MKIVFFGSDNFSLPSLEALFSSPHQLITIVTTPDVKKGRGQKLTRPVVKEWGIEKKLNYHSPDNLQDPKFLNSLSQLEADIFVVVSYGKILPKTLLELSRLFPINVHPSLLPRYRGPAPINWQIIKGETWSGVTIIKMSDKLDGGDIIFQERIRINPEEDALLLSRRLAQQAAQFLLKVLDDIEKGSYHLSPQDDTQASYAPKLKKIDGLLDWKESAQLMVNKVRGLLPWPVAYTYLEGKLLKIFKARWSEKDEPKSQPGTVVEISPEGFIKVSAGEGQVSLEELQLEGRKRMRAYELAIGQHLREGMVLG